MYSCEPLNGPALHHSTRFSLRVLGEKQFLVRRADTLQQDTYVEREGRSKVYWPHLHLNNYLSGNLSLALDSQLLRAGRSIYRAPLCLRRMRNLSF